MGQATTAFERKRAAVRALRETIDRLHGDEFLLEAEQLTEADQAALGKQMFEVSLAYQKLKSAALAALREELERDGVALDRATADLKKELEDFQRVKPLIDGVNAFLTVFSRILVLI